MDLIFYIAADVTVFLFLALLLAPDLEALASRQADARDGAEYSARRKEHWQ